MNNAIELTYELLESYLGPGRREYDEYVWQCPICAQAGGDTHKDNLKFNTKKGLFHCFADREHSCSLLSDIYKQEWEEIKESKRITKRSSMNMVNKINAENKELTKEKMAELKQYLMQSVEFLINDKVGYIAMGLKELRGLTIETAKQVHLGYDFENARWVIPTFKYSTSINPVDIELIGFEYRPTDFSKNGLRREKDMPTALAMINMFNEKTEVLVIVEGYFDGYALYQHLSELNKIDYYHIVTCSNGVQSLPKQVDEINFSKYKQCHLFIDNDEAGRKAAKEILKKRPFIRDVILSCDCKDFNEHYIKCIKKQKYVGGNNE